LRTEGRENLSFTAKIQRELDSGRHIGKSFFAGVSLAHNSNSLTQVKRIRDVPVVVMLYNYFDLPHLAPVFLL